MNETLVHTLSKKRQTVSDVVMVINDVRMYLDDAQLTVEYAILKFYCDWMFHHTLDRNYFATYMIGEINQYLFDTSIMFRKGLPQGEELACGMHMREAFGQLEYVLYKMTGKIVHVSSTFWLLYFRYIEECRVKTEQNYAEKKKDNKVIYRSAADIQRAINEGNVFTNDHLKYIPETRLSPTFDYSKPVPIWVNYMEVRKVIKDTIIFSLCDDTKNEDERMTIIYEMQFSKAKQPVFSVD